MVGCNDTQYPLKIRVAVLDAGLSIAAGAPAGRAIAATPPPTAGCGVSALSLALNSLLQSLGFSQHPVGFAHHPSGFGQHPVSFGFPPFSFAQHPHGFTQQPVSFDQHPVSFSLPPLSFALTGGRYGSPGGRYGSPPVGFDPQTRVFAHFNIKNTHCPQNPSTGTKNALFF